MYNFEIKTIYYDVRFCPSEDGVHVIVYNKLSNKIILAHVIDNNELWDIAKLAVKMDGRSNEDTKRRKMELSGATEKLNEYMYEHRGHYDSEYPIWRDHD